MENVVDPSNEARKQNATVWSVQILLSLVFGATGVLKLFLPIDALTAMMTWPGAVAPELVRIIGTAEIAGALGLVLPMLTGIRPILTSYAGFGLMVLMIGALGFHLMLFQGWMLLPTAVLVVMCAYVGVRRMP
ncbi:MAG TPA: DoxX family protein [Flavobacteriales bacterium]|nr:DoxX family protein [Flavobacteriales bacterium]